MSIQVTFNFADEAALLAFFANRAGVEVKPAAAPKAAKPAASPAAETKAAKTETATESPSEAQADPKPAAAEPSAPASTAASTVSSPAAGELPYEVLQKAVFKLVANKTGAAAQKIMAQFGVKNFKEVPPEKRAEALAAVEAELVA